MFGYLACQEIVPFLLPATGLCPEQTEL